MNLKTRKMYVMLFALLISLMVIPTFAQSPKANIQGADNQWNTTEQATASFSSSENGIIRSVSVNVNIAKTVYPSGEVEYKANTAYVQIFYLDPGDENTGFTYIYLAGGTPDFEFTINKQDLSLAQLKASLQLRDSSSGAYYDVEVDVTWEGTDSLYATTTRTRDGKDANYRDLDKRRPSQAIGDVFVEGLPDTMTPDPSTYGYLIYDEGHGLYK